ncbi:MAG: TolC family protein [Fimbriimonadaceae bacterium]
MKPLVLLTACLLASVGWAQTPPQKPNTTPIPATPPLLLPAPPLPGEVGTKPISAEEAAMIGVRLQPNVTVALAQAAAARAQVHIATAALLPNAAETSQYEWLFSFNLRNSGATSTNQHGLVSSISARQLIFDFDKTMDQVREARASAKAAEYNLSAVQANLVFQIKQQFYTVAENEQLVAVYAAEVKSTQDQLNLTVAQLSAGLGVPSDVVTASANLANATSSLVQGRETYLLSRIDLAALIGVDPRTPLVLAPSSEAANDSTDLNALVDAGLRSRPEILQAEEVLRAAGYSVSVARKQLLPSINLSADVATPGIGSQTTNDSGALGISLNWTFFDSGLSAGEVAAAKASALEAKANLVTQTQAVVSDVSGAFVSVQAAEQRVQVAASAVANAQEGLRLSEGRFKAGVTTFVEVTTAQATLVSAQSSQASAQSALQTARAQMARAIGTPIAAPKPGEITPIAPSAGK